MSRLISLHRAYRHVVVGLVGMAIAMASLAATATATRTKNWHLPKEFAAHPLKNPIPDRYKDPGVWSWMYGEPDTPSSYLLLEHPVSPGQNKRECGIRGFYGWNKNLTFASLPTVFYNAGPFVERGDNRCAPFAEYPTKTFFMHPDNASNLAAVVRWTSPITGVVAVSGTVQPTDSHVEGITWQLDHGSTIVLGPTEKADNAPTSFGPAAIAVNAGESLYFEMSKGAGGGSYDTTAVTLDIKS